MKLLFDFTLKAIDMVQITTNTIQPTKEPKKKKKKGLSSKTINIIRTTQRNNIDLTAIADNKANVLLSLNALMLTGIIPLVLANLNFIIERDLYIPLIVLAATCFTTIYLAAQVLKPSDFDNKRHSLEPGILSSPFFFGNFYKMDAEEYYKNLKEGLSEPELIKAHMAQDLYYVGKRLGHKMSKIRDAFNIFTLGFFFTLISIAAVLVNTH